MVVAQRRGNSTLIRAALVLAVILCFSGGIWGGSVWRKHALPATAERPNEPDSPATLDDARRLATPLDTGKSSARESAAALTSAEKQFGEHFRRGYGNFHAERYSAAAEDFEQAVRVAPHLPEGHYYLGEVYRKLFLSEKAEGAYREALQRTPDFRPAAEKLCILLYERGRFEEAVEQLDSMRSKTPHDPFVLGELALNYLQLGRPRQAISLLEEHNRLQGRQAWGYAQLGRAHELDGNDATAESLYREALDIDSHYALAHHWLGLVLGRNKKQSESQQEFAEYDRLRGLQTTEQELSMALLRNAEDVRALARLAETRLQLGKYQEAAATLERADRLAPGDVDIARLRRELTRQAADAKAQPRQK